MAEELSKLLIQIEADVTRLERNLSKASRTVDGKLNKIDKRVKRSDNRFNQWGKNMARSVQVGMVAALAVAGKSAIETADRIDKLQDRIKDATRASGGFDTVWKGITDTAIETGGAIENNVDLFQRLAIASKDLGATNSSILQLNDTVQKLGIISGASGSALAAGTTQLAQGLGGGILRAEEFNSIVENIPAVANLIAKNLGKSTAELRNMVLAGEVTSKMVFQALLDGADDVEKRFSEIPPRLSTAWNGFLNAIALRIDDINEGLGITEGLASKIEQVTAGFSMSDVPGEDNLDNFIARWKAINGLMTEAEINQRNILAADQSMIDAEVPQRGSEEIRLGHMTGGDRDKPNAAPHKGLRDIEAMIAASEHELKLVGKTADEAARISAEYKIRNQIAKEGIDLTEDQEEAMISLLDKYQQQVKETEAATAQFEMLEQVADQFAEDFGQIFINSVANGEDALASLGRAFKNTLIKMAADALIVAPLKQLFSPSGGDLLGTLFGSLAGARAAGGDVQGGSPYLVGERGPEIVVPKSASNVRPNRELTGGGTHINVNQTITLSPDVSPTIAAQIYEAAPMIADEARRRVAEDLSGRIIT